MSEQQQQLHHHHHHHHHHEHEDDATRFKRENLLSIKRRKTIKKWAFRALCVIALIMAIIVVVLYRLD